MLRDWVAPYGKGEHKDFLVMLKKEHINSYRDYDISFTLTFPDKNDGIQSVFAPPEEGSALRLSHHAPNSNYRGSLSIRMQQEAGVIYDRKDVVPRDDQNYFFRVRTRRDDEGEVLSALYGKIYGPFQIDNFIKKSPTATLKFMYFLNPTDNDTNLEFDIHKNLYENLPPKNRVGLH